MDWKVLLVWVVLSYVITLALLGTGVCPSIWLPFLVVSVVGLVIALIRDGVIKIGRICVKNS